jgi:hypothetical protein
VRAWMAPVISVAAVLVLIASTFVLAEAAPVAAAPGPGSRVSGAQPATSCLSGDIFKCTVSGSIPPGANTCFFFTGLTLGFVGPGCGYAIATQQWQTYAASVQLTTAKNLMTALGNSLNQTNSEIANLNATIQETLSYFEQRAEAIVPYFIGVPWNQSIADAIATYSGLVPSIEGMVQAYAYQIYQDYHSLALSWKNIYGPGGGFAGGGYYDALLLNCTGYFAPGAANSNCGTIVRTSSGSDEWFNVTAPWETWTGVNPDGSSDTAFVNLAPGGTIVCVPVESGGAPCPTYKVLDLTTGNVSSIPTMSVANWQNNSAVPVLSNTSHIGRFDLLKLWCQSACNASQPYLEASNGWIFRNASTANPDIISHKASGTGLYPDTMVPRSFLSNGDTTGATGFAAVPSNDFTLCMSDQVATSETCYTTKVQEAGISSGFGSGPSAVVGGNDSPMRYAATMQGLVNDTMNAAEVYFLTLRAITDNGTYSLPADCAIPFPSDALPASTQLGNYNLSVDNGLVLYWAYLTAVGKAYGAPGVAGFEFCSNPHLALKFSWTQSWTLRTNITASVYLGGPNGTAVYPNGTTDPAETYSNPATWPVSIVDPTLLFPYEYQADIPTNTVYPVPFNDPIAAVLVNYSLNGGYGSSQNGVPMWGAPTYLSLEGGGNAVWPNGTLSTETSGLANSSRDAVDVTSCVVASVPQNPCDISVVYFSTFTYGYQAGFVSPIGPPGSGGSGGGSGLNGGFCQSLFGWIPLIGSYIVAFCNFVLGILEVVLIILILAVSIYVVAKLAGSRRSGGRSSSSGSTVNVYTTSRRR